MKSVKLILAAAAMFVGFTATAQDFSDDALYGKWGATVEERAANIGASNFLKEAIDAMASIASLRKFEAPMFAARSSTVAPHLPYKASSLKSCAVAVKPTNIAAAAKISFTLFINFSFI